MIPRPVAAQPVNLTSRLETLPPPAAPPARRPAPAGRPRRGVFLVIAGVLLALGVGTGVWYISSGQFTKVPNLLGKTEAQARSQLSAAGLGVKGVDRKFSDAFDRGTVMNTDPPGGRRIRGNGAVTLTISRGPEVVAVPNLKGRPLEEATAELTRSGLAPGIVTQAFSQDVAQGSVIATDPVGGEKRAPDTAVSIVVSKGRPVPVPTVTGLPVEQAKASLEALGLKVATAPEQVNSPRRPVRSPTSRSAPAPRPRPVTRSR